MRLTLISILSFIVLLHFGTFAQKPDYVLVVHGGAGNIGKEKQTPERLREVELGLARALDAGEAILKKGGSAMDAIEAAVRTLEDNPSFNAGKGGVLNAEGRVELDASIMDGSTLKAGAVAGLHIVKNPITAARKVMENTPHVLLISKGAEKFAREQGLELVSPSYFITPASQAEYKRIKKQKSEEGRKGTVGAVALDQHGNLAAATSTGGMVMKKFGRVGDVPLIGAGTYASNQTCAVSATGHGEYFIRNVVSYDISALMLYKGMSLTDAANWVVMDKLVKQKGNGGIIAVDKDGNVSMPFNTNAMNRGYVKSNGERFIAILK